MNKYKMLAKGAPLSTLRICILKFLKKHGIFGPNKAIKNRMYDVGFKVYPGRYFSYGLYDHLELRVDPTCRYGVLIYGKQYIELDTKALSNLLKGVEI